LITLIANARRSEGCAHNDLTIAASTLPNSTRQSTEPVSLIKEPPLSSGRLSQAFGSRVGLFEKTILLQTHPGALAVKPGPRLRCSMADNRANRKPRHRKAL
jgi:hypothetical protein